MVGVSGFDVEIIEVENLDLIIVVTPEYTSRLKVCMIENVKNL